MRILNVVRLIALLSVSCFPGLQGLAQEEPQTRVSGRVTDAGDNPVVKAEVILAPTDFRGRRAFTFTDEQGAYRFESVTPGNYRVRVNSEGLVVDLIEAASVAEGPQADWELVGPVDPQKLPEIRIDPGHAVRYDVILVEPEQSGAAASRGYLTALDKIAKLVQEGRCDPAVTRLEDHLAGFPYKARAHYLLGFCQARLGRSAEGLAALRQALEIQPGMPGAALLAGQILAREGKADEAAKWLREEGESGADPKLNLQAWTDLAFLYRDQQRTAEAIETFEQLIRLAPEDPKPYAELVRLYLEADQPGKAEETLVAAGKLGAVDIQALLNIGIASFNEKDHAKASETFRRAIELATTDEERAMAYALLGRSQRGEGKRREAVASLKKSLELDADGTFAEDCRRILKELGQS